MKKCPFHENSSGEVQQGDLAAIHCPECGEYRISNVALEALQTQSEPPAGWARTVARKRVICTRDTRAAGSG